MKPKSFFVLVFSLAVVLSFVDTNSVSAGCAPRCWVWGWWGNHGVTTIPMPEEIQQSLNRIALRNAGVEDFLVAAFDSAQRENFSEALNFYSQAMELAERTNDLPGQAAAHHGSANVYARIGNRDLASRQLTIAGGLYRRSGNFQRFVEVQRFQQQIRLRPQL